MCNLTSEARALARWYVRDRMDKGIPFTGFEISNHMPSYDRREVSACVREIFNSGGMPGWASTQVEPGIGPVMYFKIPALSKAWFAARRIRKEVAKRRGDLEWMTKHRDLPEGWRK